MRHTIERHQMLSDGDFVAVGLSGGKDSMALLHLLNHYRLYSEANFRLAAITVNPGFEEIFGTPALNYEAAAHFCDEIDIPLHIVKTDIAEVVFEIRKEKNPCSLCANMRRGALAGTMKELQMNKLALGHHFDDYITTFLMNLIHGGRLKTLEPVSYLSRQEVTVIRPLTYVREKSILRYIERYGIPVVKNPCPADKKTARESASELANSLFAITEHSEQSIVNAVRSLIR